MIDTLLVSRASEMLIKMRQASEAFIAKTANVLLPVPGCFGSHEVARRSVTGHGDHWLGDDVSRIAILYHLIYFVAVETGGGAAP